ncbi:hypothetical protein [Sphingomonas jeddahensis]|uniref:Uncharacterized protein n=1 Tax=Sphingomonas jeddahensis TaxID=1915074 RepID=A0A1V2EV89_9SPHN|nr:hypothetical protein [Sphingomonas jeddahensis]ONF96218.1 hypothetical protein SPHI_14470 [Sphingomonas jeddahensis]
MRTLITTAALLAFVAPLAAQAEGEKTFEHDKQTYVYKTSEGRDGATVITGRRVGGDRFRLVLDGERVRGNVGGTPVAFRAPQDGSVSVLTAN